MLSEDFFSAVCGPPLAANTAIPKDAGVYFHTIAPTYAVRATYKKSSAPVNGLAANEWHVFVAQQDKSHVHVYSRATGKQEALVVFPERIKSILLVNDVLVVGTAEGRVILWEICTGRQVVTPPCHVQAVTCLAATPYHLLSGSQDSNVHVWSILSLLDYHSTAELEPARTLSDHRGPIAAVVVGQTINPATSMCITASQDKTCIIWNYQTGESLRTLLFPAAPLSMCLDPCMRAFYVSTDDGAVFLVELFGDKALIGPRSGELSSTVVQVTEPLGTADADAGPASCLAVNYDGTILLSGHPKGKILQWALSPDSHPVELANLNAAVTNIVFDPIAALLPKKLARTPTIVKPTLAERQYTVTAQLEGLLAPESNFSRMLNHTGFPDDVLEEAILSFEHDPSSGAGSASTEELLALQRQNEELREIVREQSALLKQALKR